MALASSLFAGALLAIAFIEFSRLAGVADTLRSLQRSAQRSGWIMRHRYSSDRRKEKLIRRYSLKTLLATGQLTLRLALVLAVTLLLAWGLEAALFHTSSGLDYLYQLPVLLGSLVFGVLYLPLKSKLQGTLH